MGWNPSLAGEGPPSVMDGSNPVPPPSEATKEFGPYTVKEKGSKRYDCNIKTL